MRHNWAKEVPDAKMIRDGKYPGLWLSAPATDYVALARSQGVEGEAWSPSRTWSRRCAAAWSVSPATTGPT